MFVLKENSESDCICLYINIYIWTGNIGHGHVETKVTQASFATSAHKIQP